MRFCALWITVAMCAALLFGAGAGCAQSPEDVCNHIKKLLKKEMKMDASEKMMKRCVKRWERKKEMKGYFKYRKISRCVLAADSLKEAKKCE